MTQTLDKYQQYEANYLELKARTDGEPPWLIELREKGMGSFRAQGFPVARKGNEAWKYTDIRPIANAEFEYRTEPGGVTPEELDALITFDHDMVRVVYVDGHFISALSFQGAIEGLEWGTIREGIATHDDLIQMNLGNHAEPNHDGAFVGLNTALFLDGLFVHAKGRVDKAVHILNVTTDQPATVTYPRNLIVASPLSELQVVETYLSLGAANHFTDPVTEIVVEDGAKVDHYRLMLENDVAYHVGHVRPVLKRDATYTNLTYETGTGLGRLDIDALFDDHNSEAHLNGLYITSGDQHIDNMVSIDHAKPHNTSRLYYKGILDDRSSAAFGGTVFVRKGADKTDSHQEDKNLLLSHEAEVNSKPALEIYADDVKAGHGATAGALADESLFYMQSRGIDEFTAMQLLVRGFASEITDTVKIDTLREWLEQRTLTALPRFREEK